MFLIDAIRPNVEKKFKTYRYYHIFSFPLFTLLIRTDWEGSVIP